MPSAGRPPHHKTACTCRRKRDPLYPQKQTSQKRESISASLIGRSGSSAFKLSTTSVVGVAHGLALLFGIGTEALPLWDPRMRRTNLRGGLTEAEPGGQYDLTSSIVPRGTSSHHVVERVFLPIAVGCLLSCGYGLLPDPAELGAINPNAVHDHGQPARQRHNRFLHATAFGDLHCPTLQPRPFCCADQQYLGCLVEHHPHHLVAAF